MHGARFAGKVGADIVGLGSDFFAQGLNFGCGALAASISVAGALGAPDIAGASDVFTRGAMMAFLTLGDPQISQETIPALSSLS